MTGYRYTLRREWAFGDGCVCWVMLNPSTADETVDDPTIRRVLRFSQDAGYQRLVVVNLFAARATDPKTLHLIDDPVGPENDASIAGTIETSHAVVFGWGATTCVSQRAARAERVLGMVRSVQRVPLCLGTTVDGSPRHPLYVRADQPLVPFEAAA